MTDTAYTTITNTTTTSRTMRIAVGTSITLMYLREDPNATYIPCGFCTSYRAIDPSFMAFHMLECHENELIRAPIVSHNAIPQWYSLQSRAIFITELVKQSSLMPAEWLAT